MMNRRLIIGSFFVLAAGCILQAAPISVRIQTRDGKIRIGDILGISGGTLQFDPAGEAPVVQIPSTQIRYIKFPVDDDNEEQITRLFDEGRYHKLAEPLNELLPAYMPYIMLPSNLSHKFLRWMVVSYWTGQMDRVLSLADQLEQFPGEFKEKALFYRGLAQLEKGDAQTLDTLLNCPEVNTLYPLGSAVRLYLEARRLQHQKQYIPAIRIAAQLIAQRSDDADWKPKAELLCAELYFQLNMPESAQAVLADIREFYADPNIQKKAAAIAAWK
jgi:hypothetical protein